MKRRDAPPRGAMTLDHQTETFYYVTKKYCEAGSASALSSQGARLAWLSVRFVTQVKKCRRNSGKSPAVRRNKYTVQQCSCLAGRPQRVPFPRRKRTKRDMTECLSQFRTMVLFSAPGENLFIKYLIGQVLCYLILCGWCGWRG